ncbi:MAG: hypothetical protein RLY16_2015, partial [Bacteroidota bacterium]
KVKQLMFHRGPDAQNSFYKDNVDFYHFRLSILDIGGGVQPMHLNDRYSIIFNGEIYNHQDIRAAQGLIGKTHSDTETLLLLYQKLGSDFLNLLEGMFVFAIYDSQEKTLFIARDRAGKKPLYYYRQNDQLIFASELNTLKGILPLQKNDAHFYHYLRLGSLYGSATPYHHVQELPGGSFLKINTQTLETTCTRWWSINDWYQHPRSDDFNTAKNKVDEMLHAAVRRRVESSDLEVGSFLSGGIDSGLVTAIASQYNQQLKTFTVSFNGEYDEAPLAKMVAERYQTNHTEISISFDHLKNDVERILTNYGEPFFDSSAIPSYYVSEAARKHLTVILNGDGADELFGGYRRYVPFSKYDFFASGGMLKSMAGLLHKILPAPHNKKSSYNYIYRLAALASKKHLEVYLSAGVDIFEDFEQHLLVPIGVDALACMRTDFETISNSPISGLKKLMNMDFNTTLFTDLLVKMDIATMAHSLEGRSPFLGKDLLEYAPGLNDQFKINGKTTKHLLRELAKQYLPETLINQPKRGFEIPLKKWVEGELNEMITDYLLNPNALHRQFVQPQFIQGLIGQTLPIPAEKRAKMLWTLFSLECWYQKVYLQA